MHPEVASLPTEKNLQVHSYLQEAILKNNNVKIKAPEENKIIKKKKYSILIQYNV